MRRMTTTDNNIKMDLESSMGKDKDVPHEETVEELIRKLNMKGTKVKVLKDGDNAETPQRQSIKQQNTENTPLKQEKGKQPEATKGEAQAFNEI